MSDGGGGSALEVVKQKIADPFGVVPSRVDQESALMGASLANPLDVLVIGGGATGCGDAATRGLRVGLVEREDFSSGTSSSMAEEALDTAIKSGKLNPTNKCLTYDIQLIGADGWEPASFTVLAQQYMRMKRTYSGKVVPGVMGTAAAKHLSHAYGTLAERVAAIAQNENLGKRLAHGYPFLEAEVAYCARNEHCESAVDFIARRSRLAFLGTDAANRALPRVIEILATEHNWDKSRPKQELKKAKEFLEPSSHLKMLNSTMGNTSSMELLM